MYVIELIRDGEYVYDGATSLAAQVYVQKKLFLDDSILFPYICDPTVQIGVYQNSLEEVDLDYCKEYGINIVRRDTGGGAIYLDRGGVNFCFLLNEYDRNVNENFKRVYEPVVSILKELGVDKIQQSGRNDLEIEGQKVSGAAMTVVNNRLYGGFSLLLDIDYEKMTHSLRPNKKKIESKGVKSVRKRVTTIRDHLAPEYKDLSYQEFSDVVMLKLLGLEDRSQVKHYHLTDEDWAGIDKLVEEKYGNWEWNFGGNPRFSYNRDARLPIGTVDISLDVEKGRISHCKIYGDFFGSADTIAPVEEALVGVPLREEDLLTALEGVDLVQYMGKVSAQDLVDLILS